MSRGDPKNNPWVEAGRDGDCTHCGGIGCVACDARLLAKEPGAPVSLDGLPARSTEDSGGGVTDRPAPEPKAAE